MRMHPSLCQYLWQIGHSLLYFQQLFPDHVPACTYHQLANSWAMLRTTPVGVSRTQHSCEVLSCEGRTSRRPVLSCYRFHPRNFEGLASIFFSAMTDRFESMPLLVFTPFVDLGKLFYGKSTYKERIQVPCDCAFNQFGGLGSPWLETTNTDFSGRSS